MKTIFFGSTAESVIVLEKLSAAPDISIQAVVTQPPRPVGRHQQLTPTPVETWAKTHAIPVLSFPAKKDAPWLYENEQAAIDTLKPYKADLLVTSSYGQKIPVEIIKTAPHGGLNVHPSLLPRWRGADPVPWAILSGDEKTGVTMVTLSENFDEGKIIAQKKIPILPTDTTKILYPKLFSLGADLFTEVLPDYLSGKIKGEPQGASPTPYARRLAKQDGFVAWDILTAATRGQNAIEIDRKFRAFDPWPGLWTKVTIQQSDKITKQEKRLKIVKLHL